MKKFTTATDLGGAPINKNDLRDVFNSEIWDAIESLMSQFSSDVQGVVIEGCATTANGGNFDMTAGVVFLNGEFMKISAATNQSFTKYIAPATAINDTRTFADSTSHVVTIDKKAELVGSAPGSGQYITIASLTDLDDRRWSPATVQTSIALKANKAQSAWVNFTLINGWIDGSVAGPVPGYRVDEFGRVFFRGILDATSATNEVFTSTIVPNTGSLVGLAISKNDGTTPGSASVVELMIVSSVGALNIRRYNNDLGGGNYYHYLDGINYSA